MRHTTVLKKIQELVAVHGEQKILAGLTTSGFPASTAFQIVHGDYKIVRFRRKTKARIDDFFTNIGEKPPFKMPIK